MHASSSSNMQLQHPVTKDREQKYTSYAQDSKTSYCTQQWQMGGRVTSDTNVMLARKQLTAQKLAKSVKAAGRGTIPCMSTSCSTSESKESLQPPSCPTYKIQLTPGTTSYNLVPGTVVQFSSKDWMYLVRRTAGTET